MTPYRVVDMDTWERKDVFGFFHAFANPSINVTVPLDAQRLYQYAKDMGASFFLLCLYSILRASNMVPQVRQRIRADGAVIEFTRVAAMTPIMTPAETFCQIWCDYTPGFGLFAENTASLVAAGKGGTSNMPPNFGEDFVCASAIPWLHFSAFSQADQTFEQSVPILAWGKMVKGTIPVAGKFHHGLLDGLHFSRFFASIEHSFATPESLLEPAV